MGKVKNTDVKDKKPGMKPALTPEADEQQMIYLANKRAREQLEDGTASSQVIVHFLKLGSTKAKLEREQLIEENKLLKAKTKAIESDEEKKALYTKALEAFRNYSGQGESDEY